MKRGAMELSISTIVVVIISISVLILGLLLTKNIMCSSIKGIEEINSNTESLIKGLFTGEENIVVLKSSNDVSKGVTYGVAFGVRSNNAASESFSYTVKVSDIGDCAFSESQALSFIILGESSQFSIPSGEDFNGLIKFLVPKEIENCNLRYGIEVKNGENVYAYDEFDIAIQNKKFSQNLC